MAIQIVMDRSGDTRHAFDTDNSSDVMEAEIRFYDLTANGFRAVALGKNGDPSRLLRAFDAHVEETLFIPRLAGG